MRLTQCDVDVENHTRCGEEPCSDCCDHDEVEDGFCLNCGDDRSEWLMMAVYDRAKDSRYE